MTHRLKEPVLPVFHRSLKRASEDSTFKSECPFCEGGVFFVRRDNNMELREDDSCISCGQRIRYLDVEHIGHA